MKSLLSIWALLLALPILQLFPPPPPPPPPPRNGQAPVPAQPTPLTAAECKCSIDVTVKRQSNGEPISDVSVTVSFTPTTPTPAGASATPAARVVLTEMTDITGHALFPNLAEGTYQVMAQREGYFGPLNNGNAPIQVNQVNTSVAIGPAPNNAEAGLISYLETAALARSGLSSVANIVKQPVQHVAIQLIQGGIISGKVRDANHRPASNIPVIPLQVAYQNGQRVLRDTGKAIRTDDLGQYRLYWFPPGEYYLRTNVPVRAGGPNFPSHTYYPGTTDLAHAMAIIVPEGQEVSASDFELQKEEGVTISGTVTNTLPGRISSNGQVSRTYSELFVVPRNASVLEPAQGISSTRTGARDNTDADATEFPFEIRGVPRGSYDIYPIFNDGGGNDGASPRSKIDTGHIAIEVGSENIAGIQTAIQLGVDLTVHVSVIGTPPISPYRPAQAFSFHDVRIQIRPFDNFPILLGALITPDADGIITYSNLPEARFFIPSIPGLPSDTYISEMRQGSRSIMDDTVINIGRETPDPLEIVISRGGGTISGTLLDGQHKPIADAPVYLVPDSPRRRNLLIYKNTLSSTVGAFNFQGIAPGAYKIFAWDDIPKGAEQNDEFVSKYDALGTRVIMSGGTPLTNIQVQVIPANR